MRLNILKWVWVAAIIVMISSPVKVLGSTKDEQNKIKSMINRTKQELLQKKRKERSVMSNLLKQQKELQSLEKSYQKVNGQLNQAEKKVDQTQQELNMLQRNLVKLEDDLLARRQLMNKRLVAVYKYGPLTYLHILLSSDSFGDLVSNFGSVAYFVRADVGLINEVEAAKVEVSDHQKQVEQRKQKVEAEKKQIEILQDKVSREQQKVSQKVSLTKTELSKIQTDRAKLERALDELEETSRQIEAQIRRTQQGVNGKVLGTGQLIWPVRGRISSDFGWRYHPVLKRKKYHNGLDLAVPSGTPVKAADSGVVLVSGWQGGYGNFVAIDHGKGVSTCYGHNSRLLVRVGQQVEKGDQIAVSGNTGLSTGPHLHFEVRINGNPVNPLGYL
ncbi:MAG TPA: peptidoglycan DD-metalloendopeptidase family protein [Bacillota bacterium]|nr:peptidoglycan DD-metalloendopeptidase family protein [Bacillota bacterium]